MVMESSDGEIMSMGEKRPTADQAKSALDNILGNLWQQRQELSGSSGNQSPQNVEDLSDAEAENESSNHNEIALPHRDLSSEEGMNNQVRVKDSNLLIKEDRKPSGEEKEIDPRSILANLPPLPALEVFNKHRDFLMNSQNLLAGLGGHGKVPFSAASVPGMPGFTPPHTTFSPLGGLLPNPPNVVTTVPPRPPSQLSTPSSQQSDSPIKQNFTSQQNWSFEEQFKQLYEIDDNPKRKEFLDELFAMMQKRGTPINRLPIMAKLVLDLYKLYNLVCARGGLVEVINKKQWQEVIKGLGLPSSITSAAFTLRTQYTKYLYPYECVKMNFSNPNELASAIEGNKREGHKGSYGSYPEMALAGLHPSQMSQMPPSQISPMSLVTGPRFNSNFNTHGLPTPPTARSPASGIGPTPTPNPHPSLEQTRLALLKMFGAAPPGSLPNLPPLPGLPTDIFQQQHLQRQKAMEEAIRAHAKEDRLKQTRLIGEESEDETVEDGDDAKKTNDDHPRSMQNENSLSPIPTMQAISATPSSGGIKRHRSHDSEEVEEVVSPPKKHNSNRPLGLPLTSIEIGNREDGPNRDSSMVVNMEINGIAYKGVLFAQPDKQRTSSSL